MLSIRIKFILSDHNLHSMKQQLGGEQSKASSS